jgi:hypothetical protein
MRVEDCRVRLTRRAGILARSNVIRGNGQQIQAVFVFGRGCGQECPRAAKHIRTARPARPVLFNSGQQFLDFLPVQRGGEFLFAAKM